MSDLLALANLDFKSDDWRDLYQDEPDLADCVQYLLLLEKHGGRTTTEKQKNSSELSKLVADDMGVSVGKLATMRREWTKNETLAKARAFLQPIRAEQDMVLAGQVESAWAEIVHRVLEETLKTDTNIYGIIAGAQWLDANVRKPAQSKQLPPEDRDAAYLKGQQELDSEEAMRYITQQGSGSGE